MVEELMALNSGEGQTVSRGVVQAGILHECRELFNSFDNVKVCFIRRQGNSLVDKCVKEVSADSPSVSWLACIPQWLKDAAATDCNPHMDE
jgi:hypothetical protein